MTQFIAYTLLLVALISTLFSNWNTDKSQANRKERIKKYALAITAALTFVLSIAILQIDKEKALKESEQKQIDAKNQQIKDSMTIAILSRTENNTNSIANKSDSILLDVETSANKMLKNFGVTFQKQENMINQSYRLQNTIPNQFLSSFNIQFYNDKLYNYALSLKSSESFDGVYLKTSFYNKKSPENKKFDDFITALLKDFVIRIWMKNPKTKQTILAADNVIDLVKTNQFDEYEQSGTINKFRTFASLILDENCKCFNLNLLNINVDVLYKAQNIIAISDLEKSDIYLSLSYKNSHMKDFFIQDGLSEAEKKFNKIMVSRFCLNSRLNQSLVYENLKDSLGVYIIRNLKWTNN